MVDVDRIAEPWGVRTPYAAGDPWPDRVDLQLQEGLSESDVDAWVQSASLLLALAQKCHPQTVRQMKWANASLKENAAQVMVTP